MKRSTAPGSVMIISLLVLEFLAVSFIIVGVTGLIGSLKTDVALNNKALASAAVTSCMEHALDQLAVSSTSTYAGNETLTIATSTTMATTTCSILPITTGSDSTKFIKSWSKVGDQTSRFLVNVSSTNPIKILSWVEVAQ